jgi:hypothetical protein
MRGGPDSARAYLANLLLWLDYFSETTGGFGRSYVSLAAIAASKAQSRSGAFGLPF